MILPDTIANSGDQAHQHEDNEVNDNVEVGLLLDFGPFGRSGTPVKHDLGVSTGVGDKSDDPIRVPHGTATEQEFVDGDRFLFVFAVRVGVAQDRLVSVKILVGRFAVQEERKPLEILLGHDVRRGRDRFPWLEISFTIQVLGLHKAHPLRVRSGQDDNICGNLVVIPQQNDVPNLQLLPESPFPLGLTTWPSPVIHGAGS